MRMWIKTRVRAAHRSVRSVLGAGFAEVLRGAQAHDDDAFAALWRDLHPQVLRYLRVVVGDAADDIASETWAGVARGIDRFDGDELGFRAWVFMVARHRTVDWRRREARRPVEPQPLEAMTDSEAPDDPEGDVVDALSTKAALDLIGTLPPHQGEVVALRAIAGLDVAQVAAILGKSPGAVRVLAHRGLQTLARRLADAETGHEEVRP
jgi:RNA polymerase sigma-70 factor (ECF subfamily)